MLATSNHVSPTARWSSPHALVRVAIVAALLASAPARAEPAELRREIESLNQQMAGALGRGDLAKVAAFYADDARIMGPGHAPIRGRTDVDAYWTKLREPRSWRLEVIEVGGSRDDAWQLGRSTLVTGATGAERTSVVDFIVLWRRQRDGKLRIYVDMYVPPPKK